MRNLSLVKFVLAGLLFFFVFNVWGWWNNGDIIRENTTVIIALATIVYAIFTFFMFWNMKSASEAQVRPLLFTSLKENMDLRIVNKMKNNGAKDVKIRIKVVSVPEIIQKSKFSKFINKHIWKPMISFPWGYLNNYKENYEIWDDDKSLSLSKYIADTLFKENHKWHELISKGQDPKEGEKHFKILIHISYESLLDSKYQLDEFYLVSKTPDGTKIYKNWDYH